MGRRNLGINWDEQPLGLVSDRRLAGMLGCSASTVGTARKERDIPPYGGLQVKCFSAIDLKLLYSWATAEAVAYALRMSPTAVRQAWRRNGIAPSQNWRALQSEAEKRGRARYD